MFVKPLPLIAFLAGAGFSLAVGATPVSGGLYLKAIAQMDNKVDPVATTAVDDSDSWTTTPSALSLTVFALAALDGTASVEGSVAANWAADGNSGTVTFTDYGWSVDDDGEEWLVSLNDHTGGNDWSYTFQADSNGLFSMTYAVSGAGDLDGLSGWDILWSGSGGDLLLANPNDPAASGTFQRAIVAGQTYTVSLRNGASRSGGDFIEPLSGAMDGSFEFEITGTPVPEPATLALLGLGLVGLGLSRRRQA